MRRTGKAARDDQGDPLEDGQRAQGGNEIRDPASRYDEAVGKAAQAPDDQGDKETQLEVQGPERHSENGESLGHENRRGGSRDGCHGSNGKVDSSRKDDQGLSHGQDRGDGRLARDIGQVIHFEEMGCCKGEKCAKQNEGEDGTDACDHLAACPLGKVPMMIAVRLLYPCR